MPEFFVLVMPALLEVKVDSTVLVFSAGIALVSGLTFSLLPAFSATRVSLTDALKDGSQGTQGREKRRLSQTMVAIELALSVMNLKMWHYLPAASYPGYKRLAAARDITVRPLHGGRG